MSKNNGLYFWDFIQESDEGFVMMDVLLLSLMLLCLLGVVRYSFWVYEDAVKLEQRFMAEEIMQEYMDRVEMENDR